MKTEAQYCVKVDAHLASMIEIKRLGEVDGGYQRNLKSESIGSIVACALAGEAIPAILLAKTDGKYRLLDGQHRFEAWKKAKFELWAQVVPIRAQKAVESFCTINGTSRRLALSHQLTVDPHPYSQTVRVLSKQYGVKKNVIHFIFREITKQPGRQLKVSQDQRVFFNRIMANWTADPRWLDDRHCYTSIGVFLGMVRILKQVKDVDKAMDILKGIDYRKGGTFAEMCGTGSVEGRRSYAYMTKFLVSKGAI